MTRWVVILAAGCGPEPVSFSFEPATLEYGIVDFPPEMPDDGYAQMMLSITNAGETAGNLTLPEPDLDIFCIAGFVKENYPAELGEVRPGSTYLLDVGLCGYPPSMQDLLVETGFEVQTDGDPASLDVAVAFTPNRITD
ncbi:MAG: hypothetical protein EXR71_10145 [Myxococcales bacterium]|nr:hypothetical protein [Myxococcales bacterium]